MAQSAFSSTEKSGTVSESALCHMDESESEEQKSMLGRDLIVHRLQSRKLESSGMPCSSKLSWPSRITLDS